MFNELASQKSGQLYCSVDLEFTGFDPLRDQILEIGFAFFYMTDRGAEITERWSQVFKPSIEVHPKILGLTGITLDELENAPQFNEHREFLQSRLGDCIIVGHNPIMDVKFLESYGVKLSGKTIDTLEMVQFLLPTHHSYNLENLMHYFGIAHDNAHRALGDAVSTIAVLENMVRIFNAFENTLQVAILTLSSQQTFLWEPLLRIPLQGKKLQSYDSLSQSKSSDTLTPFMLTDGLVSIDDSPSHHETRVALGLRASEQQVVLVVEDNGTVMRLWKDGLAHGIFSSEDLFDPLAFAAFMERAQTPEEIRFCLKVIVWQSVNWQQETVLDLNISFFGGQFRQFIIGGTPLKATSHITVCDYKTFQHYTTQGLLEDRKAIITNLQGFEKFISSGNGTYVSWNSILYGLRSIYNPETDYGNHSLKKEVMAALAGTDLFFALVYMLLHRHYPQQRHVALGTIARENDYLYKRLVKASQNLQSRLEAVNGQQESRELRRALQFLKTVLFSAENSEEINANSIRWVTLDESNSSFHEQPLDVSGLAQSLFEKLSSYHFTDTITQNVLLSYHAERLGLNTVVKENSKFSESGLNKDISSFKESLNDDQLFGILQESNFPVVIVMPDLLRVKNFYNKYYIQIKERSAVFAQGYSGGGNKMFRNYSIKKNSVLIATSEFIVKQKYNLAPQTIIFADVPNVDVHHPYVHALIQHWEKEFPHIAELLIINRISAVLKKLSAANTTTVAVYGLELP